jgi:hypothetical protein
MLAECNCDATGRQRCVGGPRFPPELRFVVARPLGATTPRVYFSYAETRAGCSRFAARSGLNVLTTPAVEPVRPSRPTLVDPNAAGHGFSGRLAPCRRGRRYFSRVAARKSDEAGVLGNLPRSRPGQRSDKRASASNASPATRAKVTRAKTKARAKSAGTTASRAKKAPSRPRTPAAASTASAREREPVTSLPEVDRSGDDALTGAVKLAGKVAVLPLKTAGALLRRLPGR